MGFEKKFDRRQFAGHFLACAACLLPGAARAAAGAGEHSEPPLKDLARRGGLFYGVSAGLAELKDQKFARAVAREASMLVPSWEGKRYVIERERGALDFTAPERLYRFAQGAGMQFRGHTLVWHDANPKWLTRAALKEDGTGIFEDYIGAVVKHFRGRVHSWDVINEPVEPKDGREDGLRKTLWLERFGPDYIESAFHIARAADPKALLVLNEYGLDFADKEDDARRSALLALLIRLRLNNVPVDALGIQAHLRAFGTRFDGQLFDDFLKAVAGLGYKIIISELDVVDRNGPRSIAKRDRAVADLVQRYLHVALKQKETVGLVTWGLSDRYTWLAREPWAKWPDGQAPRVLPLNVKLARKPMWYAIANSFKTR